MSKVLELVERVESDIKIQEAQNEHEIAIHLDDLLTLTKIIRLQHEKLKAIEDVNSAAKCSTDGRLVSYADWELRLIARQTLEETNRIAGGGSEKV